MNNNINPHLYNAYLHLKDTLNAKMVHRRKRKTANSIEIVFLCDAINALSGHINTLKEAEASALGAAMIAGVGSGAFSSLEEAATTCVEQDRCFLPGDTEGYTARYEMYKQLYPALKNQFVKWKEIPL